MNIEITASDFQRLITDSGDDAAELRAGHWATTREDIDGNRLDATSYKYWYDTGGAGGTAEAWVAVILAREFLKSIGARFQIAYDDCENLDWLSYWIFTDYGDAFDRERVQRAVAGSCTGR